ncbi:MAG TPA: GreA/GreB family elongation factor [Candidatus Dojkabacteria bacterium]|nr:GreA/GreB family elongation factor [Candidatus Dojkabacteria bacterium]
MFPLKKEKYKITKEKEKDLIKELKQLQEKDLIDVMNRLEESRREDSDEDDANLGIIASEKESINKRIKEISQILDNYELLEEGEKCEPTKIKLGSTVKVKEKDKILEFKLVSSIEADPLKNYISEDSPIGKKLLKAKKGDSVTVIVRTNIIRYKILDVC